MIVGRIFQITSPVLCATLHPNQAQLYIGDQSGVIHIWDVKTEHNEQLVRCRAEFCYIRIILLHASCISFALLHTLLRKSTASRSCYFIVLNVKVELLIVSWYAQFLSPRTVSRSLYFNFVNLKGTSLSC